MATMLQQKQIERIVERTVIRVLRDFLADPDRGLEVRPEFERGLKKSIASRKVGKLKDLRDVLASL